MKRILVIILILALLTGCQKEPEFNYDSALENLINSYNTNHTGFLENYADDFYADKSSSYRNLVELLYLNSTMELKSSDGYSVNVAYLYWNYDDVYQKVIADTSGFVYDIKNFDSLSIAQSEINDYVYDYLYKMILQCNKSTRELTLELEQITTAPFMFISNEELYKNIDIELSQLVYDLEQYALSFAEDIASEDTADSLKSMELNSTYLLNYSTDKGVVPISIKVLEVLSEQEAKDKLVEISPNNQVLLYDNLIYVEYEVCNYSTKEIAFSSKFYEADVDTKTIYEANTNYSGISKSYAVTPGSTIIIRDVVASNYCDLVWYDKHAAELYMLNWQ